ncbi:hypothetical protein [Leptospira licerasiae]|uniref:hypothetical protein n=1 Tax=Leptospira licerasiae TaxID=447106 RepID=UPI001FF0543C|nr:hypothetical protein [Leptospira licerasiae]
MEVNKDECYSFWDQNLEQKNKDSEFTVEEAINNGRDWVAKQYPEYSSDIKLSSIGLYTKGIGLKYNQYFRGAKNLTIAVHLVIGKYGVSSAYLCYRKIRELEIPKNTFCTEEQALTLWENHAKQKYKDYKPMVTFLYLEYYRIENSDTWRMEPFYNIRANDIKTEFRVNLYSCEVVTYDRKI